MLQRLLLILALAPGLSALPAAADETPCRQDSFEGVPMLVCEAHPARDDIRLFLTHPDGKPYRTFSRLAAALERQGRTLRFAFNAGMYHRDLTPVGLYVEAGKTQAEASTREGPGNFHMLPNGIFWLNGDKAGVSETRAFLESGLQPAQATQSGPMLVIDGRLHRRFIPGSDSLKTRNGVGVRTDGTVVFAISDAPVNFHTFARYFRDRLNTPDALYLDGSISSAYVPALGRHDFLFPLGPIVGVVE